MMASDSKAAEEVEGDNANGPNWLELPKDVTTNILQRLGVVEIVTSASQVCSLWWSICKDPLMWRTIDMTILIIGRDYCNLPYDLEEICRCAVKRSCGHLKDISIDCFATDELLKFIADSTNHLSRVRLAKCEDITDQGLLDFVNKFPLLEELDISLNDFLPKSLEGIGRCCPQLKILKFNLLTESEELYEDSYDEKAFAIAETMPMLRYLQIMQNNLSNAGLRAILDGCLHLEYLDLRGCYHVDLRGSLGKRCREQIKDLHLPDDFEVKILNGYPSDSGFSWDWVHERYEYQYELFVDDYEF